MDAIERVATACYSSFVNDEAILVVVLHGGMAVMVAALVRHRRRKEARLAALSEIEIPILSMVRSVIIVIVSIVVGPVLVGLLAALADQGTL